MGGVGSTILVIVVLVLALLLSLGLQYVRIGRSPMGKVVRICNNIKFNEKLSQELGIGGRARRFKTGAWDKNKNKIQFLPEELLVDLSAVFHDISQINDRMDTAMRLKSDSYLESLQADLLTEPISKCREQLQAWIYENMQNPEYLPKKRSIFRLQW